MNAIYHYTSNKKWEQIKQDGKLKAMTPAQELKPKLITPREKLARGIYNRLCFIGIQECIAEAEEYMPIELPPNAKLAKMYEGSFLVGLEKLEDERWKEAGLWEWLQEYTTLEILLEVPVLGNGFVREHYHLSPKGFIEKQGVDIIRMLKRCEISDRDPRYLSGLQAYVASAVPLAEYDGSFRVPEFWLQQETPVEKVRVIYG